MLCQIKNDSFSTIAARCGAVIAIACAAVTALADCPSFNAGVQSGIVETNALDELSGIAPSHKNPGTMWVHNDSGAAAKFYGINGLGTLRGTFTLSGASATDWEDIAVGPGPDAAKSYVYIADTGNNNYDRTTVRVYRVEEPTAPPLIGNPVTQTLAQYDTLLIKYPGNVAHDVETMLCDPDTGDLYLITRDRNGEGFARIFRDPANHASGATVTSTQITTLPATGNYLIKGGDISPDGSVIALRFHRSSDGRGEAHVWRRAPGQTIQQAFAGQTCVVPLLNEVQGEALGFAINNGGFFTLSEGQNTPINFYARIPDVSSVGWMFE